MRRLVSLVVASALSASALLALPLAAQKKVKEPKRPTIARSSWVDPRSGNRSSWAGSR